MTHCINFKMFVITSATQTHTTKHATAPSELMFTNITAKLQPNKTYHHVLATPNPKLKIDAKWQGMSVSKQL